MSTNIEQLPSLQQPNIPVQQNLQGSQNDTNEINNIMEGLNQASKQGATSIPNSQLPMVSSDIQQDPQTNVNFVPNDKKVRFDDNIDTNYLDNYQQPINNRNTQENNLMNDDLQIPILLSILFLLFTLPIINNSIQTHFPSFFNKDGDILLSGNLFKSILFGGLYYLVNMGINYITSL
jgi:hypothetical protein